MDDLPPARRNVRSGERRAVVELHALPDLEGVGLPAVGRRRHLGAEIANEIGGRRRIVRIDPDEHAVERRNRVHGRIGGLAVTVETRRSVRRDHEGEYPTALRSVGSRRGGHDRDAKRPKTKGGPYPYCRQSCFPVFFLSPFRSSFFFVGMNTKTHPVHQLPGKTAAGPPGNRHTSTESNAPRCRPPSVALLPL